MTRGFIDDIARENERLVLNRIRNNIPSLTLEQLTHMAHLFGFEYTVNLTPRENTSEER